MSSSPRRQRLDAELVRRGLARSRAHAGELVAAGRVNVAGARAAKAATQVESAAAIELSGDLTSLDGLDLTVDPGAAGVTAPWASRGAHKLLGALRSFDVTVRDRRALDAGASTGGFTDVLLRAGATSVVAVDVGYGQLRWHLRTDPRVEVLDRTNVRTLGAQQVAPAPGVVVADLSFISLTLVVAPLAALAAQDADFLLMVKPQFEVGRERLGSHGVVRESAARIDAVTSVLGVASACGLDCHGVAASPLPGPRGNVEYFVHLRRPSAGRPAPAPRTVDGLVSSAVHAGPSGALQP